jgi:hypothetical protein
MEQALVKGGRSAPPITVILTSSRFATATRARAPKAEGIAAPIACLYFLPKNS